MLHQEVQEYHYEKCVYTITNMDEQKIRKIIQDELQKNYRSGAPLVPPHQHNGVDNLKISQTNVLNNVGVMGKINFASNSTYTLYFSTQNPSRLDLNGFVFDTGINDSSVMIVGTAILSKAYYFQPLTTRSAKQGGIQYPIRGILAQCSSNLYVQDTVNPSNTFPHTEQFYIINAFTSSGSQIATGQLQNLTETSIDIVITNLASGWNISANFIIT